MTFHDRMNPGRGIIRACGLINFWHFKLEAFRRGERGDRDWVPNRRNTVAECHKKSTTGEKGEGC